MIQSYLLVTSDTKKIDSYIDRFAKEHAIHIHDITRITEEKPLPIESVRQLQKKLFLKSIYGTEKIVALIVPDITPEAQNALLKTLEEPPLHTFLFLFIPTLERIIPTVLSRCAVVVLDGTTVLYSDKEIEEVKVLFAAIKTGDVCTRLLQAQVFGKSKEQALTFLEKVILCERELLLTKISENTHTLRQIQMTYIHIKTSNVTPRFSLEALFLSL